MNLADLLFYSVFVGAGVSVMVWIISHALFNKGFFGYSVL